MGLVVDGARVGGAMLGENDGVFCLIEGIRVGNLLGTDGACVGALLGTMLGVADGSLGDMVGHAVGLADGDSVGNLLGLLLGGTEGRDDVGVDDGKFVGT